MRKVTIGVIITAFVVVSAGLVFHAPQPATASSAGQAVTIDPSALQSTVDVNALPTLPDIPI